MKTWHRDLAAGRWLTLSFAEQMGNVGSEVLRALNWRERGSAEHSTKAIERGLELLDLTIADERNRRHLRELTHLREALVDFFYADNQLGSSPDRWRTYFNAFAVAARASR
jgi:hypothetical protein